MDAGEVWPTPKRDYAEQLAAGGNHKTSLRAAAYKELTTISVDGAWATAEGKYLMTTGSRWQREEEL